MAFLSRGQPKLVKFMYIVPSAIFADEKPYNINVIEVPPESGVLTTNITYSPQETLVTDLRGHERFLSLEKNGLIYTHFAASFVPTYERESIIMYSKEMVKLLSQHVQADKILCYDLRLRQNTEAAKSRRFEGVLVPEPPVERPHMDHSRGNGWNRVAHHLSADEKEKYFDGKWRIRIYKYVQDTRDTHFGAPVEKLINVTEYSIWRPLNEAIRDMPLAFCDPESISEDDLVPTDQVGPHYNGEIYYVLSNDRHKWYWLSNQTSKEACIFLAWDSHPPENKINYIAHASFQDPDAPPDVPPRESSEVRLITFTRLQ